MKYLRMSIEGLNLVVTNTLDSGFKLSMPTDFVLKAWFSEDATVKKELEEVLASVQLGEACLVKLVEKLALEVEKLEFEKLQLEAKIVHMKD